MTGRWRALVVLAHSFRAVALRVWASHLLGGVFQLGWMCDAMDGV